MIEFIINTEAVFENKEHVKYSLLLSAARSFYVTTNELSKKTSNADIKISIM